MRPMMTPRMARACTALGALGATCTLTLDPHEARAAAWNASPNAAPAAARLVPWNADGPKLVKSVFGLRARRTVKVDPIAAAIRRMISGGDRIAHLPYAYGGGHGSFTAGGYDCSGSVSYVLHAGGVLAVPEDSSGLESFGDPGPGRHVTIYANAGHAWMTIDGRRYDTISLQESGSRWSPTISSTAGYTVRHPRGF
jgi:hypothetical protein